MSAAAPVTIFLHIPKACGTTLTKLLSRWCSRDDIYAVHGQSCAEAFAEIRARSRSVRLIVGHAAFGLHEALAKPARYVTVVREPIERLISNFEYIRRNPKHRLHDVVQRGEIDLEGLARRFSNVQTRYLSGSFEAKPDLQSLARAQENIERHFAVAGVADRFEETALLIHREFGRRLLPFASENVSGRAEIRPPADTHPLREFHELDYALYGFVRQRFEEQIAAQGAGFPRSVARLRQANRVLNSLRCCCSRK